MSGRTNDAPFVALRELAQKSGWDVSDPVEGADTFRALIDTRIGITMRRSSTVGDGSIEIAFTCDFLPGEDERLSDPGDLRRVLRSCAEALGRAVDKMPLERRDAKEFVPQMRSISEPTPDEALVIDLASSRELHLVSSLGGEDARYALLDPANETLLTAPGGALMTLGEVEEELGRLESQELEEME